MIETNLILKRVSIEEMLAHKDQAYNPQAWKQSIYRMAKYDKLQFYLIEPNGIFSYTRFYVSYVATGIYFFSDWSAYSGSLTNNGFCKVRIDENGKVYKYLFNGPNGEVGYAENCPKNRKYFKESLAPLDIMVSNSI